MENFKKNKGFYILIATLLAGFVAGVVLCFLENNKRIDTEDKLNKNLARYRKLLKGQELDGSTPPVSLSAKNVDASKQDTEALVKQREDLRSVISGAPANRFIGRGNLASSDLVSSIKQNVDEWTKLAADSDIRMLTNEKCEFGFRRYIRNSNASPKGAHLAKVDQQIKIIDFLFKTLVDSRPNTPNNRSAILLHSIDREPIETYEVIAAGKPNAGTFGPVEGARGENDEFLPTRSFRNPPLVEGLSFRVRFVATTPTLRTFINKIRTSGRPVVITSIEINNPQPESLKVLGTTPIANLGVPGQAIAEQIDFTATPVLGSSATPTAPAKEERKVVVHQNFSEVTLQIDYLYAPEDKPTPEAEPKK